MNDQPYRGVEIPGRISMQDALLRLAAMLGKEIQVEVNDYSHFFGAGFYGQLVSVQTLDSEAAITALVSGGQGFFLDFNSVDAFVVDSGDQAGSWLEFRRPDGPALSVQLTVDPPFPDADHHI